MNRLRVREDALVNDLLQAYERARQQVALLVVERVAALGDVPTPGQLQQLANDLTFLDAIDARIVALRREAGELMDAGLREIGLDEFQAVRREIGALAAQAGVQGYQDFAMNARLELAVGPALQQVEGLVESLRIQLTAGLREQLAAGERMETIARSLLARGDGSVFARGVTSAELMARRAVINSANSARLNGLRESKQYLPGLKKQVVAANDARVTDVCRRANRQVRELDEPFLIEGEPSFGRLQMHPPFHWNCRSSVVPYLDGDEE